jgi:hypothetical protein
VQPPSGRDLFISDFRAAGSPIIPGTMPQLCIVLKILAKFAVILAVAQAAPPVANPGDRAPVSSTSVSSQRPDSDALMRNTDKKDGKDGWDKAGIIANYLLVAVGLGGVIAAVRTLSVIRRQTNLSEVGAIAAKESAEAASRQIQMIKDKERARIEIKATGLELQREGEECWNIKGGISLRNVGAARAHIRQGAGNLIIETPKDGPPTEPDYWNPLQVVTGFIDPDSEPVTESFYFFPTENLDLSEFAQSISKGGLTVSIVGYVEYETVGTRFRREFSYAYVGHANPLNLGAMLMFSDESKPRNDSDRISLGFWRQEPTERNGEWEIPS